jgi:hypothetical protein
MIFLPFEKFSLVSPLSFDEINGKLLYYVEPKKAIRGIGNLPVKPYEGKILTNGFKINRSIGFTASGLKSIGNRNKNSFRPRIIGKLEKTNIYTTIHINMRMTYSTIIFMFFWLVFLSVLAILYIPRQIADEGSIQFESYIILFFIVFGYGIMMGGFKTDSIKSRKYLSEILKCEEIKK